MASICFSVDSRTLHTEYPRASVFTADERLNRTFCISCKTKEKTQPCFVELKQLGDDLWTHPPKEKGLDPTLVLWAEKATVHVFSSHSPSLTPPPQSPHTLSSFQERSVKKHGILQHSLQVWRREEGKKAVPPSQADWRHLEALGVRHSSSSFPHWRFYKQVSNTPDLVWQTFSKEHLKRGWESDTPTCVFFFWRRGLRQIQVSTYSTAFQSMPCLSPSPFHASFCFFVYSKRSHVVASIAQEIRVNHK